MWPVLTPIQTLKNSIHFVFTLNRLLLAKIKRKIQLSLPDQTLFSYLKCSLGSGLCMYVFDTRSIAAQMAIKHSLGPHFWETN